MTELFPADEVKWLDPHALDYTGQNSPPRWYAALYAVTGMRPPKAMYGLRRQGWQEALQAVHTVIARELGVPR